MYWRNFLNGLEFNYDKIIHQHVDPVSEIERSVVNHRQFNLRFTLEPDFP